jgi:nucleoside permease NupC
MERVIPVLGLAVLVGVCWLLSDAKKAIDWRIPAWGSGSSSCSV